MTWGHKDADPLHTSEPDMTYREVRLQGAGAAVPTKQLGRGITVSRTGAGVYRLTFAASPGNFAGTLGPSFDAVTPTDVDRWTIVCSPTSTVITTVNVYNEAGAAADLPANTWLNLVLRFKTVALAV